MINKIVDTIADALAGVQDGSTVLIGGFGTAGIPGELIDGLIAQGAKDLTVVNNNAGNGDTGLAALLAAGRVRKIICSFRGRSTRMCSMRCIAPERSSWSSCRKAISRRRMRAAGAGIGAFFTATGYGTELALKADGSPKETREIDGRNYVLEYPDLRRRRA
jgi:3-oxoadipate CoA-transferase alpha subunit